MDVSKLIEISEKLGFSDIHDSLVGWARKMSDSDCPIVLPLVGEFSSGKTSLINALTDSRSLETSTKPTTATIFEVHFGSDRVHALVKNGDGKFIDVDDIATLKNSELVDADYVKIFDTSAKISPSTLLIDTPGLSSSDPRHKQALVSFLPEADGILVVMDINAQLSRTTVDFVNTISLSGRPIYLVLTKCDTKTNMQVEETISYIRNNHQLPFRGIIRTSSSSGNLDEMYTLLGDIQKDKGRILETVYAKRIEDAVSEMVSRIDLLLASTQDDKSIQEEISKQRLELSKINSKVDRVFDSVETDINLCKQNSCRQFEDAVFGKLDMLVAGKSSNFDAEAISIINNSSTLSLNNFKESVRAIIADAVKSVEVCNVTLSGVSEIDLSGYSIDGISYNLNLNEVGHEHDSKIAAGLKLAAAVGVVAATAGAGSGAAGGAIAGNVVDIADTVSDVGSIISNNNSVQQIQGIVSTAQTEFDSIDETQKGIGQRFGSDKGIVESLVGFVTDSAMGKPQRRRAIHEYMDGSLLPSFKSELNRISSELLSRIKQSITADVALSTKEITDTLESLLKSQKEERQAYEERLSVLRDCRTELLTL